MKLLVTGSGGQLAQSLVERAAAFEGIELVALGRPQLDLEIPGSAEQAIAAAQPAIVINAAAFTAVDLAEQERERAFRINGEGAGEVASAAARAGAPIIQISTDYVFDGRADHPYREQDPTGPLGVYGQSKLAGEEAVRAANPSHAIVRTAWVYSPFGRNFVKTIMAAAETRDELTVVDDQYGSPSSSLDLADGLLTMVETWRQAPRLGVGETYHLAGSGSTSWCGFARAIMDECRERGLPCAEIRPISTADWPTAALRPGNSVLSSEKFASDFGYAMPAWRKSLGQVMSRMAAGR